ncbi:uncharacterized protein LOC129939330 [Eupeodes corollae]|uniref:uncharacterized protein LOC129939330 n=1 Tax=Eupeodes corollae TaxID=290404 RepID=UPI0024932608|nr:uncharacterized protein LOC129939330 [Eupeodes corollae]
MPKDKPYVDEIVTRSRDKSTPVLLKFQNGDLKNAHKDTTIYFPAKCETDLKRKRAVVVTCGNVYSGLIADDPEALTDNYICIRNRSTNKVRILPIDQVKLINQVYEEKQNTVFAALSKQTAKETAMRVFGGRKDVRSLNNRERNNVSIDVFREQLESTVDKSEVTETPEEVVNTDVIIDTIRPKFNKDATNLPNVYNIYDVIPQELLDRLDEEVSVLMTTDIDDIPISSEFLKKYILQLKTGPKSNQVNLNMKIIIYMDALLKLITSRVKRLKKFELSQITEKVENDIRERFTTGIDNSAIRTTTTNEKAICYFLVLAFLLTEDFQLDMNVLSSELGMSKVKIAKYANLICAVPKARSNFLQMRLPTNVTFIKSGKYMKARA